MFVFLFIGRNFCGSFPVVFGISAGSDSLESVHRLVRILENSAEKIAALCPLAPFDW